MINILRTIAAGCLLHNIQEEGEQELDSEGKVLPTLCNLALFYILTSLRSIPRSWIKAHHAEKTSFLATTKWEGEISVDSSLQGWVCQASHCLIVFHLH